MADLKLKIKKVATVNPSTKAKGFSSRVVTAGTTTFEEIARQSANNTTLHPKEAELAASLLIDGVRDKVKQGFIIDLGPLGKLYPSVSGKWTEKEEDQSLNDLTPKVTYRPSDEIAAAIKGASMSWASEKEAEKTDTETEAGGSSNGGTTPTPPSGDLEG